METYRLGIYLSILETGILNIRAFAHMNDAKKCHLEADHIHNIPMMIRDMNDCHYVEVAFKFYRREADRETQRAFEPYWKQLGLL